MNQRQGRTETTHGHAVNGGAECQEARSSAKLSKQADASIQPGRSRNSNENGRGIIPPAVKYGQAPPYSVVSPMPSRPSIIAPRSSILASAGSSNSLSGTSLMRVYVNVSRSSPS